MLDQKDVQLIREMMEEVMDKRFAEQEAKLDAKLDERFAEQEAKLDAKLDERFAEQEAKLDAKLDERFAAYDVKMDNRFAQTEQNLEERLTKKMQCMLRHSEGMLLDEIERTRSILENRMDKMDERLERVESYCQGFAVQTDRIDCLEQKVKLLGRSVRKIERVLEER